MNAWKAAIDADKKAFEDRQRELNDLVRINNLQQRAFQMWKDNSTIRLAVHDVTSPIMARFTIRIDDNDGYYSNGLDNWRFKQIIHTRRRQQQQQQKEQEDTEAEDEDDQEDQFQNRCTGIIVAMQLDMEAITKLPTTTRIQHETYRHPDHREYEAVMTIPIRFIEPLVFEPIIQATNPSSSRLEKLKSKHHAI